MSVDTVAEKAPPPIRGAALAALAILTLAAPTGAQDLPPARQVTLFGVVASGRDLSIDPKLAKVAPQLRKLLPDHGFRLIDVQSKRLTAGESMDCDLGNGYTAAAVLVRPTDDNGKVQIRCVLTQGRATRLETLVTAPPNQLFFCDKAIAAGGRLLIGIGAR
jgi:hypothetical protein